ncbi:cytochrome P450 [Xylariaceae sp. FL0016]|nr:cytochrome P450 [Xylariaceae sp. FL0016]
MDSLLCVTLSLVSGIIAFKAGVLQAADSVSSHSGVFVLLFAVPFLAIKWYRAVLYPRYFSPLRHLPTAKGGLPFIGHAINHLRCKTPSEPYIEWMKQWPEAPLIRYISFMGKENLFAISSEAHRQIFQAKCYDFQRPGWWNRVVRTFLGSGLVTMDGDMHVAHRKMVNPCFAASKINALLPTLKTSAAGLTNLLDRFIVAQDHPDGAAVLHCSDLFARYTLDIIGVAVLGKELSNLTTRSERNGGPENDYTFHQAWRDIFDSYRLGKLILFLAPSVPFLRWLPLQINYRFKRATAFIFHSVRRLIRERKAEITDGMAAGTYKGSKDILSFVVEESLPGGAAEGMDEQQLVDHITTFLGAGFETSALALSWVVYALVENQEVQRELRAEASAFFDKHPDPSVADINSLTYAENVIKETLRLWTPVVMVRQASRDVTIDGTWIPRGTDVDIFGDALQRNPTIWGEDAEVFDPTRWDRLTATQASPHVYMAFGAGPKGCIGRYLAMMEMKVILIEMIRNFEFICVEGSFTVDVPSFNLHPSGMKIRMRRITA